MPGMVYNAFAGDLRADMRERLATVRDQLEASTRQDAPVDQGELRRSIVMAPFREEFSRFVGTIRATADQARYTNDGTGVYAGRGRIYPRNARALVFYWRKAGAVVAFTSVRGQPAQHWWDGPSGDREEQRLDDACRIAGLA